MSDKPKADEPSFVCHHPTLGADHLCGACVRKAMRECRERTLEEAARLADENIIAYVDGKRQASATRLAAKIRALAAQK